MAIAFPFLSRYHPWGRSGGTLDPRGLYDVADQLATQLVPAAREQMQRVRILTALGLGALLTKDVGGDSRQRDAKQSP